MSDQYNLVHEYLPSSFSAVVYSSRTSLPRTPPDGRVHHAASNGAAAAEPTSDDEQTPPAPSPKKKLSKGEKMRKRFQEEMDEKVQQAVAEALKAQSSGSALTTPSPGTVNAAHGQGQQSPDSSAADSSSLETRLATVEAERAHLATQLGELVSIIKGE